MDQMDLYSTEYFMLLTVTWYLSQVLPSEYDNLYLARRKLFGIGETKQDRRKSFLESGLWHIDPKRLGQKTMTSEKSGVEF